MTESRIYNILGVAVNCLSWSLEVNDHFICYALPEEYYDLDDLEGIDTSMDIYVLRIYPITPVGFVTFTANSIDKIVEDLKGYVNGQ